MASHPVVLSSKIFSSKKEATVFFKEMLNKYHNNEDINSEDDKLLFELIQRHPEVKDKIGVGIKRFYKGESSSYATSCFHLERVDGSTTDFSYPACISHKEPTLEDSFYKACYASISQELYIKKKEIFKDGSAICVKTGDIVTILESEYRHTKPRFRDIVRDFIRKYEIEMDSSMFFESKDMQYATEFSDPQMASKFRTFHAKVSNLEIFKK